MDDIMRKIHALPIGHFLIKSPDGPACVVRAPFVDQPRVSQRNLEAALRRIHSDPSYLPPSDMTLHALELNSFPELLRRLRELVSENGHIKQ